MDFACTEPPSFACVTSGSLSGDTSRLPAYRPSHLRRFHPYCRTTPATWQRILTADEEYPPEDMRPFARRSSFALTDDILANSEVEIVVGKNSVKVFIEQHWRSRKFRVVVDYFATLFSAKQKTSAPASSLSKKRKIEEVE